MALITISTTDLDGVTIKKVATEEGTKVGAPGAEINVLDARPEDTDEHYYIDESKYLQHASTGAIWQANIMTKHQRTEPVNEQLERAFEYEVNVTNDNVKFAINSGTYITSLVDGRQISKYDLSGDISVTIPKSDYANAKAFNEAHVSKHGVVTTAKRYASSEGQPVVKETEFSIAYPALKYYEARFEPSIGTMGPTFSFNGLGDIDSSNENYQKYRQALDAHNPQVEVSYNVATQDGKTFTGTVQFSLSKIANGVQLTDSIGIDFGADIPVVVTSESYTIAHFTLEGFDYKFEVAPTELTKYLS